MRKVVEFIWLHKVPMQPGPFAKSPPPAYIRKSIYLRKVMKTNILCSISLKPGQFRDKDSYLIIKIGGWQHQPSENKI